LRQYRAGLMTERRCFRAKKYKCGRQRRFRYDGMLLTCQGLAVRLGVTVGTIYGRLVRIRKGTLAKERLFEKGNVPHAGRLAVKSKRYVIGGERMSVPDMAERYGISEGAVRMRLHRYGVEWLDGWLHDPYRRYKGVQFVGGERRKPKEVVAELGLKGNTLGNRFNSGWTVEAACTTPRVSATEAQALGVESRMRNIRKRELLRMGLVV